uniref:Uncharacterized protein n=1 Tax=Salix viminalis TaxID=40686 RepID=A0A6N2L1Y0_SALVM
MDMMQLSRMPSSDKNNPEVEQGRHIHEMSKEPDTRESTFARNHVDAF